MFAGPVFDILREAAATFSYPSGNPFISTRQFNSEAQHMQAGQCARK